MNFEERQLVWRRNGLYGLPTNLFGHVMQFETLRDITTHAAVNKYSRDTIYDPYYNCFTKFDLNVHIVNMINYNEDSTECVTVCDVCDCVKL